MFYLQLDINSIFAKRCKIWSEKTCKKVQNMDIIYLQKGAKYGKKIFR